MREARGWTQQELADRVGASRRSIQLWEDGEVLPLEVYRRRVADVFQVTMAELMFKRATAV